MFESRITNGARADFDRNGVVVIRGFFTLDETGELKDNLHRYMDEVVPKIPPRYVFYQDKKRSGDLNSLLRLEWMNEHDPYYDRLRMRLMGVAEALLGEPVIPKQAEMFEKAPRFGEPPPPHQDGFYFMLEPNAAVTLWIPLERADEENGCVRYVRNSHKRGMRNHELSGVFGFSLGITDYGPEDEGRELIAAVEAGDLVAHHAMTIHRTDANASDRTRRAMGLIYWAASSRQDIKGARVHEERIHKQWKEGGDL